MSKEIDEFIRLSKEQSKDFVKPQIVWGTVKSVDWSSKTMTATSVVDELDYFNVLLGLGSVYRKPKVGSKCLLGVIQNHASATFLIECEDFEQIQVKSNDSEFTIDQSGFTIKKGEEDLKSVLTDFMNEVSKIVVLQGTTVNVAAITTIKQRLNTVLK